MANRFVVFNVDTLEFLQSIAIGFSLKIRPCVFTRSCNRALHFENEIEAQSTINFIADVLDFELGECLDVMLDPLMKDGACDER